MQIGYVYKITLKTLSPLLVGGRTQETNSSSRQGDRWIIPASSMKGALTEHLKNHTVQLGEAFVEKLCGKQGDGKINEGTIRMSDFTCKRKITKDDENEIRTRVSVNPMTGSTEPEALLTYKCVKAQTEFEGYMFLGNKISEEELRTLISFLETKNEFYIGANQTVGLGLVQIKLERVKMELYETFKPGMYLLYYRALSPFVSTEHGSDTLLKKYFITSKNYIPSTTMRSVLSLRRLGYFYPTESLLQVIPVPTTDYFEKYSRKQIYSCLKPLTKSALNKQAFLLSKSGQRLEHKPGYKFLNSQQVIENKEICSFHVALSESTRVVGTSFWVQRSFKPNYWVGYVFSDAEVSVPRYITVGAARSKGYGLLQLEKISEYSEHRNWIRYIKEYTKIFGEGNGLYVPFIMTSHYFCERLQEDFGGEIVQSFVDYGEYRFYDPNEQEGKRVKVLSVVLPGSVIVIRYSKNEDELLDFLLKLKQRGIGGYTELGFGDFEIYPVY